ncbi:MAG: energy transducer TonB [Flavobacteriales bacterium]|jgi:periplasmic protein TonB|nr:energy transducer TonB [Flavobacteriales bacterium]
MESKKNSKVSLENKKGMFLQIGLMVALIVVLVSFEWKSYDKSNYDLGNLNLDELEEEIIPITRQEVKPPPPPPPPEIIEIVEDEVEIENEVEIEETETDENEIVEIEEDDEEIFMVVENMPLFPGGDLGLMKFIQKNVKYPAIAKEYNITGKVYVSFIVDRKGKVTNVKIVRGVDKNLDAEALRVVSSLPRYTPGKQRGKAVRVMFTIPINFTLN